MSDLFGFEPAIRVEVLGPKDWRVRAEVETYGPPHVNEAGTMYRAAIDSALFDDAVAFTLEHLDEDRRRELHAVSDAR